jgi:hypothetical protein
MQDRPGENDDPFERLAEADDATAVIRCDVGHRNSVNPLGYGIPRDTSLLPPAAMAIRVET